MPSAPRVSCVIPCYNHAKFVERAIRSVLGHGGSRELIVVDDGSTDESFAIASQIAAREPALRVVRTPRNGGASAARNLGARQAKGEFLCFLDADDEYLPGIFEVVPAAFDANPKFGAVRFGIELCVIGKDYNLTNNDRRLGSIRASAIWNFMFRQSVFSLIGGFPEDEVFRSPSAGEDVAMNMAVRKCFTVGDVPDVFVKHYCYPGSHTSRFLDRAIVKDGKVVLTGPPIEGEEKVGPAVWAFVETVRRRVDEVRASMR